jgi:hypothetical protein
MGQVRGVKRLKVEDIPLLAAGRGYDGAGRAGLVRRPGFAMVGRMTLKGSCHCGGVTIEVPGAPEWLGSCNCSICRRTGALFAYYPDDAGVAVAGETVRYIQGDRMIALHHCGTCGCATHWDGLVEVVRKVGVNARLLDGFAVTEQGPTLNGAAIEVRFLDNAD